MSRTHDKIRPAVNASGPTDTLHAWPGLQFSYTCRGLGFPTDRWLAKGRHRVHGVRAALLLCVAVLSTSAPATAADGPSLTGFLKRAYRASRMQVEQEEQWKRGDGRVAFPPVYIREVGDYSGKTLLFPLYWHTYDRSQKFEYILLVPILSGRLKQGDGGRVYHLFPLLSGWGRLPDDGLTFFGCLPLLTCVLRQCVPEGAEPCTGGYVGPFMFNYGRTDGCQESGLSRPDPGTKYRLDFTRLCSVFTRVSMHSQTDEHMLGSSLTLGPFGAVLNSKREQSKASTWLAWRFLGWSKEPQKSKGEFMFCLWSYEKRMGKSKAEPIGQKLQLAPFVEYEKGGSHKTLSLGPGGMLFRRKRSGDVREKVLGLGGILFERQRWHSRSTFGLGPGGVLFKRDRKSDVQTSTLGPVGLLFGLERKGEERETWSLWKAFSLRTAPNRTGAKALWGLLFSSESGEQGYHRSVSLTPLIKVERLGRRRTVRLVGCPIHRTGERQGLGDGRLGRDVSDLTHHTEKRRLAAAQDLACIRDSRAVPALAAALGDPSEKVRHAALSALVEIGDSSCAPAVVALLENGTSEDRWRAARALGQLRAESATAALEKALSDPAMNVRKVAKGALTAIRKHTKAKSDKPREVTE